MREEVHDEITHLANDSMTETDGDDGRSTMTLDDRTDADGIAKQPNLPPSDEIKTSLVSRIISHLTSENLEDNHTKAYNQGNAAVFSYICGLMDLDHSHIVIGSRKAKREFFNVILTAVCPSLSMKYT